MSPIASANWENGYIFLPWIGEFDPRPATWNGNPAPLLSITVGLPNAEAPGPGQPHLGIVALAGYQGRAREITFNYNYDPGRLQGTPMQMRAPPTASAYMVAERILSVGAAPGARNYFFAETFFLQIKPRGLSLASWVANSRLVRIC